MKITDNTLSLSKREMQILELIALGFTSEEIGQKLFISKRTVDTHRSNMLHRSGAKNCAELLLRYTHLFPNKQYV